jgi:hypothetical protein
MPILHRLSKAHLLVFVSDLPRVYDIFAVHDMVSRNYVRFHENTEKQFFVWIFKTENTQLFKKNTYLWILEFKKLGREQLTSFKVINAEKIMN